MFADSDVGIDGASPMTLHSPSAGAEGIDVDDDGHTTPGVAAEVVAKGHARAGAWRRFASFGLVPSLALMLALGAGYLKWMDGTAREAYSAAAQSVSAATDSTIALLSYRPETVEKDLTAAGDRLTGSFRDAYSRLVHDVVIPGARQKQISAVATVPAAASMTAGEDHAVVLVFVNQTITSGTDAPTSTASSIRITLDKVANRWLISQFDPI